MGSKKRSARAKQVADFMANLGDTDDAFARERERVVQQERQHESALRRKACESKKRYFDRADAEEAIRSCAAHGTTGCDAIAAPTAKAGTSPRSPNEGRLPISRHRERGRLTKGKGVSIRATSPEGYGYRQRRHDRTAFVLCRIAEERRPAKAEGDELSPALDVVDDQTRESPPPGQQERRFAGPGAFPRPH